MFDEGTDELLADDDDQENNEDNRNDQDESEDEYESYYKEYVEVDNEEDSLIEETKNLTSGNSSQIKLTSQSASVFDKL